MQASTIYEHIARPLQLKQSHNLRITLAAAAAVPALFLPPFLAHIRLSPQFLRTASWRGGAGCIGFRDSPGPAEGHIERSQRLFAAVYSADRPKQRSCSNFKCPTYIICIYVTNKAGFPEYEYEY